MLRHTIIGTAATAFVLIGAASAQEQAALRSGGAQIMLRATVGIPEEPGHGLVSGFDTASPANGSYLNGFQALEDAFSGRIVRASSHAAFSPPRSVPAPLAPNVAEVP